MVHLRKAAINELKQQNKQADEEIRMPKYLVTGVAGLIGRSIAAALIARGESVRGIDNFITGKMANLSGLEAMEFI